MISSFVKISLNFVKIILFKLKGHKAGFQKEIFYSLKEINNCQGYKNTNLIKLIFNRAKKARANNLYEVDSVILNKPRPNKFFVEFLLYDYIKEIQLNKKIKVLDYGGSFGSTFFSLEKYINLKFNWYIHDQKKKIQLAKKNKIFKPIKFIYEHEIKKNQFFDIILFSNSLQYCEDPLLILKKLKKKSKVILISNIILTNFKKNYLKIERPHPTIHNYTYPCWFLSKSTFQSSLKKYYSIFFYKIKNVYPLVKTENYYNLKLINKK